MKTLDTRINFVPTVIARPIRIYLETVPECKLSYS